MGALRRGSGYAIVALSAASLLGACTQHSDVVADVQEIKTDAAAMEEMPDADIAAMEPPMCELAQGYFTVDEIVNKNDCKFTLAPQLVAWIQLFSARGVPPPGEERGPMLCEAAGLPFYPDPMDPMHKGIICEATCNMIREALVKENERYRTCKGEEAP